MPDISAQVEIPNRALFRAAEVCDLVKVQPYVLRSWESEFPDLGVAKSAGAQRVYRRVDVAQVVRIKHLLLVEGLTLAGARRKLEEEGSPAVNDAPPIEELADRNARERLTAVKRGLRSILDLLSSPGAASDGVQEFRLAPGPRVRAASRAAVNGSPANRGASRGKGPSARAAAPHTGAPRRPASRRKRSA